MIEERLTSSGAIAAHRPASAAVAERPEADHARALDAQFTIPGMDADGDDTKLTGAHVGEYRAPEWA